MIIHTGDVKAAIPVKTASQKYPLIFSPVKCFLFTKHKTSVDSPRIEAIGQKIKINA